MTQNTYKIGETYFLKPIETGKDSRDNDYLVLIDKEGDHEYRVYPQLLKFQEDELPPQVPVRANRYDIYGRIAFVLDEISMIHKHYQEGKPYSFTFLESRVDPNTEAHYYLIEDDFARHRFYMAESEKFELGEDYVLEVKGFNDKGYVKFSEHTDNLCAEEASVEPVVEEVHNSSVNGRFPVLDIGDERTTLELKTSIVFSAESSTPDIDNQLDKIVKVLCGFMNAKGGDLYIGVHDQTKQVVGFANDYEHLNEGNDDYNGSYKPNHDGYKLKIRNAIDRKCPSVANSLINIQFESLDGAEYCKIHADKAKRPIWFNRTQLLVRQGNRLKQLKGDDITFFIYDRMTFAVQNSLEMEGSVPPFAALTQEDLETTLRKILNEKTQSPIAPPPPPKLDEVNYWINWLADGSWKRTREKATDKEYVIQVPVPKNISEPRILICYESGKVNAMQLNKLISGKKTNMNKLVTDRTWNLEAGVPVSILVASQTDLLVGYSMDYNGVQYVKFHSVSDFSTNISSTSKGAPFVPENFKMLSFRVIDSSYKRNIAHLQRTKTQRSQQAGEPIESVTYANEIEFLNRLWKTEAQKDSE